jgi:hypothetical protein
VEDLIEAPQYLGGPVTLRIVKAVVSHDGDKAAERRSEHADAFERRWAACKRCA